MSNIFRNRLDHGRTSATKYPRCQLRRETSITGMSCNKETVHNLVSQHLFLPFPCAKAGLSSSKPCEREFPDGAKHQKGKGTRLVTPRKLACRPQKRRNLLATSFKGIHKEPNFHRINSDLRIKRSKRTLGFKVKRGFLYWVVRWAMSTSLCEGGTDGADESVLERAVISAVCRLFPIESPPRYLYTASGLAACSEVDHWTAQYIALMVGAYSGYRVGQHTPRRPPNAGGM